MYLDFDIAKNVKTSWNEKMSIYSGFEPSVPDEFDFCARTETLEINFRIITDNMEKIADKLAAYLPYNKEFLISLDGKIFDDENPIKFPAKNAAQEAQISKAIREFVKRGNKNKFKDYIGLKSGGKDKYSSMKIDKLKDLIDEEAIKKVSINEFDPKYEAVTYRWILRGLPVDMAIHKVKIDLEVMNNVRGCSIG